MGLWRRDRVEERTAEPLDVGWPLPVWESQPQPAAALRTPDVWACTRVLADAAASCPLHVYRRLPDGGRQRAEGRTAELLRRPAEGTTQANLVATVMAHLALWGNAYLGKYRGSDVRVEQLVPIPPERVRVQRRAGGIVFVIMTEQGRQTEHGLDDIVQVKGLSTDGLVGLSPIRQMRQALELNDAARLAQTSLFRNNGRPSGILKVQGGGGQGQLDQLRQQWEQKHGADRAGGIAVLSGEVSFDAIAMPADDAEFVAARKLSAVEIARCFRIPPWMIAAETGDSLTYSNVEGQQLAFVTHSLRPWLIAIEQALSADRDLFTSASYCEFLIDSLLRADSATRAAVYTQALNPITGWMRRDEVRRLENLEPEDSGALRLQEPSTNGQGAVIA
jgi:HK97 family phage portal protein